MASGAPGARGVPALRIAPNFGAGTATIPSRVTVADTASAKIPIAKIAPEECANVSYFLFAKKIKN